MTLNYINKTRSSTGIKTCRRSFYCIEELVKEKVDLSENIIKDIHSLVLIDKPQDKGRYRRKYYDCFTDYYSKKW